MLGDLRTSPYADVTSAERRLAAFSSMSFANKRPLRSDDN